MEEIFAKERKDTNIYKEEIRQIGQGLVRTGHVWILIFSIAIILPRLVRDDLSLIHSQKELLMSLGVTALVYVNLKVIDYNLQLFDMILTIGSICNTIATTEKQIQKFPDKFEFLPDLMAIVFIQALIKQMLLTSHLNRNSSSLAILGYYLSRNMHYYGFIPTEILAFIPFLFALSLANTSLQDKYVNLIIDLCLKQNSMVKTYFTNALKIVPNGVFILNLKTQEIVFNNQELLNILEINDSSDISEYLSKFKVQNQNKCKQQDTESNEQLKDFNESKSKQSLLEYLLNSIHPSGLPKEAFFKNKDLKKYIQVHTQLFHQETQIIVIVNNITRIKELEKEQQQMKSMFFASIAHELRTPLNTIIPISTKLTKLIKDTNLLQYAELIKNSSIYLSNIIEEALDMSRIENDKFQINLDYFNIRQTVRNICGVMEFQSKLKNIELIIDVKANVPEMIKSDEKRYSQILYNLIGNAIKFTFKGKIIVRVDLNHDYLYTKVEDTGVGIPKDEIKKLFKFFGKLEKTKTINKGGMGFGLTICKMLVEQMNGNIQVHSDAGKGSTFSFHILVNKSMTQRKTESKQSLNFEEDDFIHSQLENYKNRENPSILIEDMDEEFEEIDPQGNNTFRRAQMLEETVERVLSINTNISQRFNQISESQAKLKVLGIDDQPYNIFVLKELLLEVSTVGEIQTTLDGNSAIEIIIQNSVNDKCTFDYILIDLHMPVIDGFQVLCKLRTMEQVGQLDLRQTRVIAVSAITQQQFYASRNSDLFEGFMEKPISLEKLESMLQ